MKLNFKHIIPGAALLLTMGLNSCMGDLDVTPIDPSKDMAVSAPGLFNKCYAGLVMEGNDGDADFTIDDAGKSCFVRQLSNLNDCSTDVAICWWTDGGFSDVCTNTWNSGNETVKFMYYRLMSNITFCNHYLDVCSGYDARMTAEVRFLRALYYYYLQDFFGNVPFLETISSEAAPQKDRKFMFTWLEKEFKEAAEGMAEPKAKSSADKGYGRADKAAAWLMLSRLYLNAEVYTGTPRWADASKYAKMVLDSDYELHTTGLNGYTAYETLFMGDNGENGASEEAILPLLQDGVLTRGYGGSRFFIASTWENGMLNRRGEDAACADANWRGTRVRPEFLQKFFPAGHTITTSDAATLYAEADAAGMHDDRCLFWGAGCTLDLGDNTDFKQGFATVKWQNRYATGGTPHDPNDCDGDVFLLRKAEAYLNYAEAVMREKGGCPAEAKNAIDAIRLRSNKAVQSTYSLDDLLDERAREFYIEGYRRPDLIRFGYYGGDNNYLWSFKGGVKEGARFEVKYNLFAIPETEINSNRNLHQNTGF